MDINLLRPWNTHWERSEVSPLILTHPTPRAPVPYWVDELVNPPGGQWQIIAGPRQIGKTTGLGHVAKQLLARGIAPRSISFVPLDQPAVQETVRNDLDDLVHSLATLHPPSKEAPLYLLLDEVQELEAWAKRLKAAWDQHRLTTRVIATGSSALNLIRPANADFPGRIRIQTMHAMKFREVVLEHPQRLKHANQKVWDEIERLARDARDYLKDPEQEPQFKAAITTLHGFVNSFQPPLDPFLRSVFQHYVVWGGYPRARAGNDIPVHERRAVFEQALNAVLAKDLPATGISKTREFTQLFSRLVMRPGGKFVAQQVAQELGVKATTVADYKRVLEDALLVNQLAPLNQNLRSTNAKDKAYPNDPGWFSYMRGISETTQIPDSELGLLVEAVLVDHARRIQYNLAKTTTLPIGYVDSPEVDIAASLGSRWLLIEAKYRTSPKRSLAGIGTDGRDLRVIATRNHFEVPREIGGVYLIPAHLWALIA